LRRARACAYLSSVPDRDELAPIFLRYAPVASPTVRARELEAALQARWDAGRIAWPGVVVGEESFLRFLADRSGERLPPLERSSDLYIACACAHGVPAALEAFRRSYRAVIAKAIQRRDPSDAFLDDVLQALSVKLFVSGGEGAPGITQYEGRSSLRAWLATAATRTALNMRRRRDDEPHGSIRSGIMALPEIADPELLLLKARYKNEFEAAIRAAVENLPGKQRTLLLMQIVDALTLPQLAAMHRVSRATVARWLAAAREAVFEATRLRLMAKLRLSTSEYESVVALVRSQLDVSLATLLPTVSPPSPSSRRRPGGG
jgi:RNA polymerase sigma-70 factor (ECF subfamily)